MSVKMSGKGGTAVFVQTWDISSHPEPTIHFSYGDSPKFLCANSPIQWERPTCISPFPLQGYFPGVFETKIALIFLKVQKLALLYQSQCKDICCFSSFHTLCDDSWRSRKLNDTIMQRLQNMFYRNIYCFHCFIVMPLSLLKLCQPGEGGLVLGASNTAVKGFLEWKPFSLRAHHELSASYLLLAFLHSRPLPAESHMKWNTCVPPRVRCRNCHPTWVHKGWPVKNIQTWIGLTHNLKLG